MEREVSGGSRGTGHVVACKEEPKGELIESQRNVISPALDHAADCPVRQTALFSLQRASPRISQYVAGRDTPKQ